MRLAAKLADPQREKAELEVGERVGAVRLGEIDQAALEHEQAGRVGAGGQGVTEALQLVALFRGLGRQTRGGEDDDQRDRKLRQTRAG
jgi:hypothetical protein